MSGDGYEYPDEAGYPDGTGMLDEGTGGGAGREARDDEADAVASELDEFAMSDEEDDEEV
ncbi:hypothetical protein GE115_16720 [Agromyces sp. CFH 90414]|uniref:Uncharacterized protein n=1 Tax=Agromyces agglutinans TaxID=2662258 RepID=A0A6I2F9F5_9MICO|nr:hypothetical protein [Agromyces agglutinans]MRG61502.1 hypothetical protein [Agromyces agglutinans]